MKQLFSSQLAVILATVALASSSLAGTAPRYENFDIINAPPADPPAIDAVEFINHGIFNISTAIPFETQNTLYFTNRGNMRGSVGYQFDLFTPSGRRPAASFNNRGEITALDPGLPDLFLLFGGFIGSRLIVDATNIVNTGVMSVGGVGLLSLNGVDIDVSRSGLLAGISDLSQLGSPFTSYFGDNMYLSASAVSELYWGVGINGRIDPQNTQPIVLDLNTVVQPSSGPHEVIRSPPFTNITIIPFNTADYAGFANTNTVSPTNQVVQVVFVQTNFFTTNATVDVRFGAPTNVPAIPGTRTAYVLFSLPDIDAITGLPFTNRVYVSDALGAVTNAYFLTNAFSTNIWRPNTYDIALAEIPQYADAQPGNAVYTNTLILNPQAVGTTVSNDYAALSVLIGAPSRIVPGTTPTPGLGGLGAFLPPTPTIFGGAGSGYLTAPSNFPARVEINAEGVLDMYLTRVRTDGLLKLNAKDFTGRSPQRTDSPFFQFDLGATSGSLIVSNVIPPEVRRLAGTLSMWSGIWTNQLAVPGPDPMDPMLMVTNFVEVRYHAFILDASQLGTVFVPETIDGVFNASHVEFHDHVTVTTSLRIDAESFHNLGDITMVRPQILGAGELPRMRFMTNEGSIDAPDGLTLGIRPAPRAEMIVNSGTLSAGGIRIASANLDNSGIIAALGDFILNQGGIIDLELDNAKFDGGSLAATGDVRIQARDIKAQNSSIQAGDRTTNAASGRIVYSPGVLVLNVTDRLTDGDGTADNQWTCYEGFQLPVKPTEGDLLGTTIRSVANRFSEVFHLWAAEDRGATEDGYVNNVALGRLVLEGDFSSLFTFAGAGLNRALYVNFLELAGTATNVLEVLNIAPGFKIYFMDSNLPADQLDGLFDGRLVRVQGVQLPLGPVPFNSFRVRLQPDAAADGGGPAVAWSSLPGGRYRVEYTTDLSSGQWQPLGEAANGPSRNALMHLPRDLATQAGNVFVRVVEVKD